ncbi:MAG: hypothetical protein M3R30_00845 [Candidatus Eremiobacteraeota bacterium]|nr:hypothetical protein [Candidatus Eremiobacteraeota bacterium]
MSEHASAQRGDIGQDRIVAGVAREPYEGADALADRQRRMARALGERTDRFLRTLEAGVGPAAIRWRGGIAGAHIFLELLGTPRAETTALLERAERAGVRAYDGARYFMHAPTHATLLCGYATLSLAEIERGVIRLAGIVT